MMEKSRCSSVTALAVISVWALAFPGGDRVLAFRPPAMPRVSAVTTRISSKTPVFGSSTLLFQSAFQQLPGESRDAYFKRVTAAASDPGAFERMALQKDEPTAPVERRKKKSSTSLQASSSSSNATESLESFAEEIPTTQKKRRGYVRAEEWEKEQQQKAKEMSWDERVQFEGQRHGNRFNQNEILRHHLHTY
jgi:hypothetical protein